MPSDEEKQAIRDLKINSAKLGFPLLLVGGGARVLVFDNRYRVQGRSTTDWDWGVRVNNWEAFNLLINQMTTGLSPLFKKTSVFHRFEHIATRTLIDLIPFGEIAQPGDELHWPGNRDCKINVLGYQEALENAEEISLDNNITIEVVSIPAFLVLKLVAWQDRGTVKDLQDVALILRNYSDLDKIYENLEEELINGVIEFEDAGSFYLGREISKIFQAKIIDEIGGILDKIIDGRNRYLSSLVDKNVEDWDLEFDLLLKCFETLRKGLNKIS